MKWVLLVLAVAVVVVGGVAAIGLTLPEAHVVSRSAILSAPPDTVWGLVTNVSDYPKWRKDVQRVEQIAGVPRLTWREFSSHDKMTYEVIKMEPKSHFVSQIADKGLGFGGSWDYTIEPDGKGSKITITESGQVYNPLFRFVSEYVIGQTATLDKYLTALSARTGDSYKPGAA
jgi:Polyketide cyclase / dehydrase and lipid transport.